MKYILIPIAVFFLFFIVYSKKSLNLNSIFYIDEYSWVGRGYYFDLLLKGDFNNKLWNVYGFDGDPKMNSYIYGLANYSSYLRNKKPGQDMFQYLIDNNLFTGWLQSKANIKPYTQYLINNKNFIFWQRNEANGKTLISLLNQFGPEFEKTLQLILNARKFAIVFFCLSVVFAYFIAHLLFDNLLISLILSLAYGLSFLLSEYGAVAYGEPILLFFINLGLLIILWIIKQKGNLNNYIFIILGFVIACANQTKLNGVILLFIWFSICAIKTVEGIIKKDKNLLKQSIIQFLITLFSFIFFYVILDPFLIKNPIRNVFSQYQLSIKIDQNFFLSRPTERLGNFTDKLLFINKNFFDYSYSYIIPYFFVGKYDVFFMLLCLKTFFLIGIISMILKFIRDLINLFKSKNTLPISINIFLFIIFCGFNFLLISTLNLAWARYTAIIILPTILLIIFGILSFAEYYK